MTFNPAPWAVDGARITSSLARLQTYASTGGAQGVVGFGDLKVSPLDIAGNGVQIAAGGGLVLNRYQTSPTQTYVVENPTAHIVGSSSMPGVSASERYFILAVVVGDPEGDQNGHPFMPSEIPDGQETTFTYVRPVLVSVASATATDVPLTASVRYPALPLARIRIKANSQTITSDDITDLRKMARPRSLEVIEHVAGPSTADPLNGGGGTPDTYERWPNVGVITTTVPDWATTVVVTGFVEGAKQTKAGGGKIRVAISGKAGKVSALTNIDETAPKNSADRKAYNLGGEISVSDLRGQTVTFIVEGTPNDTASKGFLTTDANTSVSLRALFQEKAI